MCKIQWNDHFWAEIWEPWIFFLRSAAFTHADVLTHNVSYPLIYYLFSEKRFCGCFMTKIDPCIDSITFPKVNEKKTYVHFLTRFCWCIWGMSIWMKQALDVCVYTEVTISWWDCKHIPRLSAQKGQKVTSEIEVSVWMLVRDRSDWAKA